MLRYLKEFCVKFKEEIVFFLSIWQGYSASWWTWDSNIYTSIWFVPNHASATPSKLDGSCVDL
jgi:hypothetical protein